MHISRILGIVGFVLALIGNFLPWASMGGMSISGSAGDGWFPVVFLIPVVVLAFLGDRKGGFGKGKGLTVLILGVLATLFMIWKIIQISGAGGELGDLLDISLGIGIFVETAGAAVAAVGGFLGLKA